MPNTFKNKVYANLGTAQQDIYVTPASTTSTVIGLSLANTTVSTITVSVKLIDTSTATTVYLIKDAPLPAGSSLVVVGGDQKVVLEAADKIAAVSSLTTSVDVVMSVLEIT